jgi:hypothetical protein
MSSTRNGFLKLVDVVEGTALIDEPLEAACRGDGRRRASFFRAARKAQPSMCGTVKSSTIIRGSSAPDESWFIAPDRRSRRPCTLGGEDLAETLADAGVVFDEEDIAAPPTVRRGRDR